MAKEIWKPVPVRWLSRAFEISNFGNVRHTQRPVHHRNIQGYRQVTFKYRGRVLNFRVHRLVATAFLHPPKDYEVVNHINCDRADNRIENLEWTTVQGNTDHSIKMGTKPYGLDLPQGKIDPEIAFQMRKNGCSYQEIADRFGASKAAAHQMIKRALKSKRYR